MAGDPQARRASYADKNSYWSNSTNRIKFRRKNSPMGPPSPTDIESELSYAYLHAVVSHAAMCCHSATRLEDNNGIDAQITAWGPFPEAGDDDYEEVDLKIQLKATIRTPAENETHYSPDNLKQLMAQLSRKKIPTYENL